MKSESEALKTTKYQDTCLAIIKDGLLNVIHVYAIYSKKMCIQQDTFHAEVFLRNMIALEWVL